MAELTGPEYLSLCFRATAFEGVMAARVAAEKENDAPATTGGEETTVVNADLDSIKRNAALADVIEG